MLVSERELAQARTFSSVACANIRMKEKEENFPPIPCCPKALVYTGRAPVLIEQTRRGTHYVLMRCHLPYRHDLTEIVTTTRCR